MNYKAIIFDMDGTIITTELIWQQATKQLLKNYGNLSDSECLNMIHSMKGSSLYTSCSFIKDALKLKQSINELILEKQQLAFNNFHNNIQLIDGFDKFHQSLTNLHMKSAIATNSNQQSLNEILRYIPLKSFFNEHIYSIDIVNKIPKPKPDIYLYAAQRLKIQPEQCIAIEDSKHGIAAAKAANMYCIGINTGKDNKALAQADYIIESYNDINLKTLL